MAGLSLGIVAAMLFALYIVSAWKVFEKADQPGWAIFVPLYSLYTYAKVAGLKGASIVLYLIPFLNIIYHFSLNIRVAKRFGYSSALGVVLAIAPWFVFPILAFGDNTYQPVENSSDSVVIRQPSQVKTSNSNVFIDENGDHVEKIRLEDW